MGLKMPFGDVELYVIGEWTSIRKASLLWNISELGVRISNRLTSMSGESVNYFQELRLSEKQSGVCCWEASVNLFSKVEKSLNKSVD